MHISRAKKPLKVTSLSISDVHFLKFPTLAIPIRLRPHFTNTPGRSLPSLSESRPKKNGLFATRLRPHPLQSPPRGSLHDLSCTSSFFLF